jgi:hypothetical protein
MNHAHGSPFDRGSADSFYHRVPRPHYICDIRGERIEEHQMSAEQIAEYKAGYEDNHKQIDSRKEYQ